MVGPTPTNDNVAFDRRAVLAEMDAALATFRELLASADRTALQRRSSGTRWTNEQLLFHMLFGYMVVRPLLLLVRAFGRLPDSASRRFAVGLDFVVRPFDTVNYWGSVAGARIFPARRMSAKLDRVITSLQRRLEREADSELRRRMYYPVRWDPFFHSVMSLADIYHYPTQHFDFHRRQLSL